MKIIEKKDNKIVFAAQTNETIANAVRRYLNQIPILAINELEISKNDSPLYDETIAHRTGLIPLKNESKKSGKLKLSTKQEGIVYSEELKGDVKVIYDKIPITLLNKGQEIEFSATVESGKGSEHSKFSPGLMFHREVFDVKIEKDCPKEIVGICPQGVFALKDGKIIVTDNLKCDGCEECIEYCKKHGKEGIKVNPTEELLITVESFGQMTPEEMLKKSAEILKKDLAEVTKKVGK